MERVKRASKTDQQDQYVLTVFLPLLAVAILACIGGCCYMERRRRKRKKRNGGIDPEELRQQEDIDDAASIISTSSSRRRHYLDPTPTTGRLVRGVSVRSNYSTVGEPLYEMEKRRRGSGRNREQYFDRNDFAGGGKPDYGDARRRQRSSYNERPLSRARSMVDVRHGNEEDTGGLRRARSSSNLGGYRNSVADSGYQENQSNDSETDNMYEFLNSKPGLDPEDKPNYRYNRPPSPTQSEWSVRTAPPRGGHDDNMRLLQARPSSRPSSMMDFPLQQGARLSDRNPSLTRSRSQPDLNLLDQKTYPHGILKKGVNPGDERRLPGMSYQTSTDSGIKDVYADIGDFNNRSLRMGRHYAGSNMDDSASHRPSTRPPSVMSYSSGAGRRQNYEPYPAGRYGHYSNAIQHPYGYSQPPPYSITGSGYHHHQLPGTEKYAHSYDPYGAYDYWDQRSHQRPRMSMY